jgi:hypothetical protein
VTLNASSRTDDHPLGIVLMFCPASFRATISGADEFDTEELIAAHQPRLAN